MNSPQHAIQKQIVALLTSVDIVALETFQPPKGPPITWVDVDQYIPTDDPRLYILDRYTLHFEGIKCVSDCALSDVLRFFAG